MIGIIALITTFGVGFILRIMGRSELSAWLLSWTIMPAFILFVEFALPYRGSGASMWPIALIFGGFYGVIIGGVGVLAASYYLYLKRKKETP